MKQRFKKGLTLWVAVLMLLAILPVMPAHAESYTAEEHFTFNTATGTITGYNPAGGNDVSIPPTIGGVPVTAIGSHAFEYKDSITSVVIPEGVTGIGDSAFSECYSLGSITLPSTLTSIGNNAFLACMSLSSVNFPNGLTSIGSYAFASCYSLSGSIVLPDSARSIGDGAFMECYYITGINIPEGITGIGNNIFTNCANLRSVSLPSTLTSIGNGSFASCNNLVSIIIPGSVTSIGDGAFSSSGLTSLSLPDGLETIGDSAFNNCQGLSSIAVPDSVTSIGENAFGACSNLVSITLPAGITSIADYTFDACNRLNGITIPASVTSIGNCSFKNCWALNSITIPAGVTSIGAAAFQECSYLTSVTIPASVTYIGVWAFYNCSQLTGVYFLGDAPEVEYIAPEFDIFVSTSGGLKVYYPYGTSGWTNPWHGRETVARCTVTYDSCGGSAVASATVNAGGLLTQPAAPMKGNTSFAGWYRESSLQTPWNFGSDAVTENITLYAKWNTIPNRKAGIPATTTASVTVNTAYTLNLATIFEDADADPLTYKVSVNGASDIGANASYTYTPSSAGNTTLVFKANDGTADSADTYSVTLTAVANDFSVTGGVAGTDYTYEGGVLTFIRPGTYQVSMKSGVTSTATNKIVVNALGSSAGNPVRITLSDVDIQLSSGCAFEIASESHVRLTLSGDNWLSSTADYAGLLVVADNNLTIDGSGTLLAEGGSKGAGIGGGNNRDGGTINISGAAVVKATGGDYAAGIGGGNGGSGGTITLTGGMVFAEGKNGAKDIGAGNAGSGGTLQIADTARVFLRNDNCVAPTTTTHTHSSYTGHGGGSIYGIPVSWTGSFGAHLRVYTLSYNVNSGSGTVAAPVTQLYSTTATVSDGSGLSRANYTFAGWNTAANGGGTTYAASSIFTFSADTVLYAQWTVTPFTLSYDLDGGAVSPANPVSYTIESDAITLNNPAKTGYTFTGWSGTGITGNSMSVTIAKGSTGNRSYTAHWTAIPTTGTITGTVTDGTNPVSGADVSLTVSGSVYSATTVANGSYSILYVPAGTGYTVTASKSGYISGSATNVNVTANTTTQNINITLTTIPPTTHTVSVSANPSAGGNVAGGGTYNEGASVTVTATPNSGYTFTNWTEGGSPVSTGAAYTFTLGTSNRTLVANFTAVSGTSRTVTVTSEGNGTATGGGTYNQGQSVTLGAIPAAGYNFDGWYAGATKVSSLPNYTFTVTENISLTAKFTAMQKDNLEITTVGSGAVKMNSDSTGLPANYLAQQTRGASITLTATANSGNAFAYWQDNRSGSILSTNPVYEFVMGAGVSLKGVFNRIPDANTSDFTVIFKDKSGRILQSTNVAKNAAAVPPASPSLVGYSFTGWNRTFNNVTSDMTISALYERLPTTYTVTVVGGALSTGGTSGSFKYDMPVTVVAGTAPTGQKFSHWEQDGVKISINGTYSFFTPMWATTLTAVFVPTETVLVEIPFITLSTTVQVDTAGNNMLFTANRTVPAGYTLIESGILLLQSNTPPSGELTVDTAGVIRGKIKNDSTNQFHIRKNNIADGDTWYGRAYLIYRDADGNIITVYSANTESRTMN